MPGHQQYSLACILKAGFDLCFILFVIKFMEGH